MTSLVARNFEDYNCYFVVKYGNAVFAEGTVVKRDIVMNNSILVCDVNDRLRNEWVMDYDLYPVNPRNVGGMILFVKTKKWLEFFCFILGIKMY